MLYCSCGRQVLEALPVEPLYSLPTAAALLPVSMHTMRKLLVRYRSELHAPLYHSGRRRYLLAQDVQLLRSKVITGERRSPSNFKAKAQA